MNLSPYLHTRLKSQRTFEGLSLQELSAKTGISKQDLSRIENGQDPNEVQLVELIKIWPELNRVAERVMLDWNKSTWCFNAD